MVEQQAPLGHQPGFAFEPVGGLPQLKLGKHIAASSQHRLDPQTSTDERFDPKVGSEPPCRLKIDRVTTVNEGHVEQAGKAPGAGRGDEEVTTGVDQALLDAERPAGEQRQGITSVLKQAIAQRATARQTRMNIDLHAIGAPEHRAIAEVRREPVVSLLVTVAAQQPNRLVEVFGENGEVDIAGVAEADARIVEFAGGEPFQHPALDAFGTEPFEDRSCGGTQLEERGCDCAMTMPKLAAHPGTDGTGRDKSPQAMIGDIPTDQRCPKIDLDLGLPLGGGHLQDLFHNPDDTIVGEPRVDKGPQLIAPHRRQNTCHHFIVDAAPTETDEASNGP